MDTAHSNRRRLFWIVNLVAFAAILYWLQENISITDVVNELLKMPVNGLLGALILNLAVLAVYGDRLSLLLAARRIVALGVVIIGFGMNGVLPFRLGEVAKVAYAKQIFNISTSRLFAATAVEKLMDLCALLLLSMVVSQLVVAPYLNQGIVITALLVGVLSLAILFAFLARAYWERTGRKTNSWIAGAFETLRAQNEKVRIIHLAAQTVVIWAITVASIFWMFSSVFPVFSITDASALTLVLALAIAVPSAPAGLGVVEAAIVAYLHQSLLVEANKALASALAFHLAVVAPQILMTVAILITHLIHKNIRFTK